MKGEKEPNSKTKSKTFQFSVIFRTVHQTFFFKNYY